jgi:hypothetical protein
MGKWPIEREAVLRSRGKNNATQREKYPIFLFREFASSVEYSIRAIFGHVKSIRIFFEVRSLF